MRKPIAAFLALLPFLAVMPRSRAQGDGPAKPSVPIVELMRYEPTGISIRHPYARGKVPVVFVHGLWVNPWSWHRMIDVLDDDPALNSRFQFWTFGYSTGDPIPYSAYLLRRDLDEVRHRFDPDRADPAFDRMVFVGHSMGGLVSKMMAVGAGDHLWREITDRPFSDLAGDKDDVELFRKGLLFEARPEVRRVVYIATPHRGSRFDRGSIHRVGTRLVRVADPLRAAHDRLVLRNGPDFFREHFRRRPAHQHRRAGMGLGPS